MLKKSPKILLAFTSSLIRNRIICYLICLSKLKKYSVNEDGSYRVEGPDAKATYDFTVYKDEKEQKKIVNPNGKKIYFLSFEQKYKIKCEYKGVEINIPPSLIFSSFFNWFLIICVFFVLLMIVIGLPALIARYLFEYVGL